ncbi:MAG: aminoacetone oxidase family FAD-binding enzyme, partial [Planctomycetes bacterium]|nr:aminoacetone oxidase family FAD-binding enzyme [Planctomycetota bacterium]
CGVAVVGAGAAGTLAAIFAARRGARVRLIEGRARPGAKIRVSGGGRCNVLPSHAELGDFHSAGSMRAVRNVLFSWPLEDVRRFFEIELGIALRVEPTGKVFPRSDDAREVVDALLRECDRAGVDRLSGVRVVDLRSTGTAEDPLFELRTAEGPMMQASRLVLATGGLSLPKTGSDGWGIEAARALGHAIAPLHPVLVPLTTRDERWLDLPGVSTRARVSALSDGRVIEAREGDFLFTHRGFSGPVVLDISHRLTAHGGSKTELRAFWGGTAGVHWEEFLLAGTKTRVVMRIAERLPRRLADLLVDLSGLPVETRLCDLRREQRLRILGALVDCPLPVDGDEGYRTAEATGGGVRLEDVKLKTLESRILPGLHFAGEMLDVHGRVGGYNFLWAWVSGRRAGEGAAEGARAGGG